jgi:hypothetical protein
MDPPIGPACASRERLQFGSFIHLLRYASSADCPAGVIRDLAAQVGVDGSGLRRCARVAETIGPDELSEILAWRTSKGLPLKWSHLEVLALERNRERRRDLATAAVAGNLSVRALSSRLERGGRRNG